MRSGSRALAFATFATFAALAAGCAKTPAQPPAELATARETAQQVMAGTKALLEAEMKDKGPAGALGACSKVAFDLARAHEQEGWRVRRVSDRLRNPADAPDAWESARLADFAGSLAAGTLAAEAESWEVVTEEGRLALRYAKPLLVPGEVCLKCHGDPATFEAAVRDSLARLYPQDRATGYRVGDLRGAITVRIPI